MYRKIFSKVVAIITLCTLCLSGTVCEAASSSEVFTDYSSTVTDELQYTDALYLKGNSGTWSSVQDDYGIALQAEGISPQLEFPKGSSFEDPFAFAFSVCFEDAASSLNVRANYNGAGSGWHSDLKDLIIFKDGTVTGKFTTESTVSYVADTWYHVVLTFDFDSATYDAYINGTKISDTAGSIGGRSVIKHFRIAVNGEENAADGNVFIDNMFACDKPVNFASTVANGSEIEITQGDITLDFGTFVKYTDASDISITCNGAAAEGVTLVPEMVGDYFKTLTIDVDGNYEQNADYEVTVSSNVKSIWGESAETTFAFSTLEYVPAISVSVLTDTAGLFGGEKVKLGIETSNVSENEKIIIYNNGAEVAELASDVTEYQLAACDGENNVTAKVLSSAGEELAASDAVQFTAGGFIKGKEIYSVDFETSDILPLSVSNGTGNTEFVTSSPGGRSGVVYKCINNSSIIGGANKLTAPDSNGNLTMIADVVVFEEDRYYESSSGVDFPARALNVLRLIDSTGARKEFYPWTLKASEITPSSTGSGEFSLDKWHHIKTVYDFKNSVAYLYVDGVLVDKGRGVTASNYYLQAEYQTMGRTIYFDNMKAYFAGYTPTASVEVYNGETQSALNSVDYNNASFKVIFTERMDSSTLTSDTVKLTSQYGENVECTIAFADAYTMTVTPKSALAPDTEYSFSVKSADTVKIKSGAGLELPDEYLVEVKTIKPPFAIQSATISGGVNLEDVTPNAEFTVNLSISDALSTGATAGVFVGIYKDNACYGINYIDVDASVSSGYIATLKAPADIAGGGYEIKTFMVDNLQSFKLLDFE